MSVEPLLDTWDYSDAAGSWSIALVRATGNTADEGNEWFASVFERTCRALASIARPLEVVLAANNNAEPMQSIQRGSASLEDFIRLVQERSRSYRVPLVTGEINLETLAYVRTRNSPEIPALQWLALGDQLRIRTPLPEDPSALLTLTTNHTLFRSKSLDGESNQVLHSLNQPRLEAALRAWEANVGPISFCAGLPDVFRYGFLT